MTEFCYQVSTITGPEEDRIAFLAKAGATFDFNVWVPYPEEFKNLDEAARQWDNANYDPITGKLLSGAKWEDRPRNGLNSGGVEWRMKNWGTNWNAATQRDSHFKAPPFNVTGDTIACEFETPWSPPIPIFELISDEFPTLKIEVQYSVEDMWDCGTLVFENGNGDLIEHQVGWFRTPKTSEPVHHRVAAFDVDDERVKELIATKILFKPETAKSARTFAFRCVPEELGVSVPWTRDYTLDDEIYLESCVNRAGYAAVWGGEVGDGGAILCNCPISLTKEEIDWLLTKKLVGTDQDYVDYRNRIRDLRQRLFADFAAQYRYPTNREELSLLLAKHDITDERRKEIAEAMTKPRWTTEWPQWRKLTTAPPTVQDDDDFMAELERI